MADQIPSCFVSLTSDGRTFFSGFLSVCIFYAGDKSDCVCGELNALLCVSPPVPRRSSHKRLGLCWNEREGENEGARKERQDGRLNPSESRVGE